MSAPLGIAAGLCLAVAVAHSVLGERYILTRLFRRGGLPRLFGGEEFTRRTLRFAWHLTSVAWAGFGAQLLVAALPGTEAILALRIISVTFLLTAAITLVWSRARHLAWIVFLAIAVLTWAGGLSGAAPS